MLWNISKWRSWKNITVNVHKERILQNILWDSTLTFYYTCIIAYQSIYPSVHPRSNYLMLFKVSCRYHYMLPLNTSVHISLTGVQHLFGLLRENIHAMKSTHLKWTTSWICTNAYLCNPKSVKIQSITINPESSPMHAPFIAIPLPTGNNCSVFFPTIEFGTPYKWNFVHSRTLNKWKLYILL